MNNKDNGQIFRIVKDRDKNPDKICGELLQNTKILPSQCYLVNEQKDVFIKFPNDINVDYWMTTENLKILKDMGLIPKLTSNQIDMNTVFVNSAPREIFDQIPEELMAKINSDNPNIFVTNIYVPPPKSRTQNLGSLKLTMASRLMTNSVLYFGIKLLGRRLMPDNIQQGHYLTVEQCTYCQGFHPRNTCHKYKPTCAHCGGQHQRFECKNKEKTPWCSNCTLNHKATSNICELRRAHMSTAPIDDISINLLVHPYNKEQQRRETSEQSFAPAPAPEINPWTQNRQNQNQNASEEICGTPNVLNNTTPLTTYYDCLRMSLLFDNWYDSFLMLQPLLGLPRWEMPPLLRQNMKGSKEMHPSKVREEAQQHQENLHLRKQQQWLDEQRARQNNTRNNRQNYQKENQPSTSQTRSTERPLTGANREPLQKRDNSGPNLDPTQKRPLLPTPRDPYSSEHAMTQPIPKTSSTSNQITNLAATQPSIPTREKPAPNPAVKEAVRCFENLSANESLNTSRNETTREHSSSPENAIQFTLGTYREQQKPKTQCKPSKRETFKHTTPEDDSDTDAEVEIEEDTLPDLRAPSETSRRVLRSNSRTSHHET